MVSLGNGVPKTLRTLPEPLATWVSLSKFKHFLAPEVMCRQNHGVAVDYFAVGVMAYECMFGRVNLFIIILNRDLTWGSRGRRSETTFCPSRSKSREMKYPKVGRLRLLTLLTR